MLELKVNPWEDALLVPAMQRFSLSIKALLQKFKDDKITLSNLQAQLTSVLMDAFYVAVERGYNLAVQKGNIPVRQGDLGGLKNKARYRAEKAAKLICKSSKKALEVHASITKDNVASKKRSDGIVEFEMPRMLFMGMRKGWSRISGTRMPTKAWFTTNENSCEVCQENEDAGPIPLDEEFPSGDMDPGIHPGCECIEGLYI